MGRQVTQGLTETQAPTLLVTLQWICILRSSVKTEDDFWPPAGDGAPARENAEGPAEDEGPVTPLLLPEAPVKPEGPVTTGGPGVNLTRSELILDEPKQEVNVIY